MPRSRSSTSADKPCIRPARCRSPCSSARSARRRRRRRCWIVDGWRGIADRIHDPAKLVSHVGWLVVIARRTDFPDPYAVSAVHVAVALVEASQRMTLVARQQEQAIRAAVLEEALALRRIPEDPELAGRIASLGLSFADELRIVVAQPVRTSPSARGRARPCVTWSIASWAGSRSAGGSASLVSVAGQYVRAACASVTLSAAPHHRGLGRSTPRVMSPWGRHESARVRTLPPRTTTLSWPSRRSSAPSGPRVMTYEDFDFATRLFSDIGIDRMTSGPATSWRH